MPRDMPNFALLIGKKKSEDAGGSPMDKPDHAADLGLKDGLNKEQVENSALKDLVDAVGMKDVSGVKMALKDFLEACYPQLSDMPEDDQSEPTDEGTDPEAE